MGVSTGRILGIGAATAGMAAAYPLLVRRWCLTWGATGEEARRPMPGDELLVGPGVQATRAITITAPPEAVWPWLVQMGSGRGGAYTYDWIENLLGLDMHSADQILPEYQDLKVGDVNQLGRRGPRLRVEILEPERALVLRSEDGDWVWAFILDRKTTGTRLISRNRFATPGVTVPAKLFNRYVMEPGSLVMERKMLLGIKERAELSAQDSGELHATV